MTSEEIKALGLRVGEYADVTQRHKIHDMSEDVLHTDRGVVVFDSIVAIERVMPGLPDGWTWTFLPEHAARADNADAGMWAVLNSNGGIQCWEAGRYETDAQRRVSTPALVAKALLEVWGRTQ